MKLTLPDEVIEKTGSTNINLREILAVSLYQMKKILNQPPGARSLYRPVFEKDNCGFGLIAQSPTHHPDGQPAQPLAGTNGLGALARLTHRGAVAADGKTGDGCDLLMKKPDSFLRLCADELGFNLAKQYAVGMVFLNADDALATPVQLEKACQKVINPMSDDILPHAHVPQKIHF